MHPTLVRRELESCLNKEVIRDALARLAEGADGQALYAVWHFQQSCLDRSWAFGAVGLPRVERPSFFFFFSRENLLSLASFYPSL